MTKTVSQSPKSAAKLPVPAAKLNRKPDPANLTAEVIKAGQAKRDAAEGEAKFAGCDPGPIPAFLDRTNGKTSAQIRAATDKVTAKNKAQAEFRHPPITKLPEAKLGSTVPEGHAERQKEKARVRVEKMLAKKSGATSAMPLSGKQALAVIAKDAVENGKVKVTKVPAGVSGTSLPKDPKARAKAIDKLARKGTPMTATAKKNGKIVNVRKDAKAKPAKASKPRAEGPAAGSMAEKIGKLAMRAGGASRAELIKLSGWEQQAWKWYFWNSKDNGYCQKFGFKLNVIERKDGVTAYHIVKK